MSATPVTVDESDLLSAYELASFEGGYTNKAFVCLSTGKTYIVSDFIDTEEDLPDDLETSDDYVRLPHRNELGLGRDLVFDFILEEVPDEYQTIRAIFGRKGAYGRFKYFLAQRNLIEKWYLFQEQGTSNALREWCDPADSRSPASNR